MIYTGAVMMPVNKQLLALTEKDFEKSPKRVKALWKSWGARQIGRVAISWSVFLLALLNPF
jgi:hypothetical protein